MANKADVKRSYFRLAKRTHPDAPSAIDGDFCRTSMDYDFTKISTAYQILSDPDKRKQYDRKLRQQKLQANTQIVKRFSESYVVKRRSKHHF